ncbi:hypothetical protein [Ahrensia marina]|uniref:Uncharacterized protein n=1 Tax=Ahrensia marina TaxID=1514904 RepID=A0A0M9GNN8_9HYPH|nr:hypothetical protein [Ahrensia marina]KPB02060.1 hypothetical protein SU32_04660 [Ahrensia marina]
MSAFLDATPEDLKSLDLNVARSEQEAQLKSDLGVICTVKHGITVSSQRDSGKYYALLCNLGPVREAGTCIVSLSPGQHRLGFAFPLTALKSGVGIEEGWPSNFAEVGFRKLTTLENIHKYSVVRSMAELKHRELYLDELYSDNLTMFVFSREALANADVSTSILELMLLERGVYQVLGFQSLAETINGLHPLPSGPIKLRLPCLDAQGDSEVISELIKRGDADVSGVGGFLQYYQILEFCIDRIFQQEIRQLPSAQLDTWALKEQLGNITSERKRIAWLDVKYLRSTVDRNAFEELKVECIGFLKNSHIEIDEQKSWHECLYKVRNIIVHNQIKMHRTPGRVSLQDLNMALRKSSFELLLHFDLGATNSQLVTTNADGRKQGLPEQAGTVKQIMGMAIKAIKGNWNSIF